MELLKYKDGVVTYPYPVSQLLTDNPQISFPFDEQGNLVLSEDDLAAFNTYYAVYPDQMPTVTPWVQRLEETNPVQINGKWVRQFFVTQVPEAELAETRAGLIAKVKQIRDYKTENGGYFTNGKWFHSNVFSRTQQVGLVISGQSLPPGLMWKSMDGSFIEMTPSLAAAVFTAAVQQDTALFAYAEYLINQINTSSNPDTIDLYSGWPATFNNV